MLLGLFKVSQAQVIVNFLPAVYGTSIDGMAYAQIMSTYPGELKARAMVKVKEIGTGQEVVVVRTGVFILRQGANMIGREAFNNSRFSFKNNNRGLMVSQTGRFPEGEYEYCFEIDISESKNPQLSPVYEYCFVHRLQQRTPLLLINPVDEETFCNQRPHFFWQPPSPLPPNARYRLVMVEAGQGQDPMEAITFNVPLINQMDIPVNNLSYPSQAPALKEGSKYVWQVIVYIGQTILSRSEVWTFTCKCEQEDGNSGDSYRALTEVDDGAYLMVDKWLRFSLLNPYSTGTLNYTIYDVAAPDKKIKGLPKLRVVPGLNKFELNLDEISDFKNGHEYHLRVQLGYNKLLNLRFIYIDNK
ncbi:MAG: hypothetical protein ACO1NW_18545 [Chitinophagaceae bacterium]